MIVWARNLYPIVTGSCRKQMQKVKKHQRLQCSSSYYKKDTLPRHYGIYRNQQCHGSKLYHSDSIALYTTVYKII